MLAPELTVQPASRSNSRLGQYVEEAASEAAAEAADQANMAAAETVALGDELPNHKSDSDDDSNDEEVSFSSSSSSVIVVFLGISCAKCVQKSCVCIVVGV